MLKKKLPPPPSFPYYKELLPLKVVYTELVYIT